MSWDESQQPWGTPQVPPGGQQEPTAPYGQPQPGYGQQPGASQYPQYPQEQQPQQPYPAGAPQQPQQPQGPYPGQQQPYPQQQPPYGQEAQQGWPQQPQQQGWPQPQPQYGQDPQQAWQQPYGAQPDGGVQQQFGGYAPQEPKKGGKGLIIGLVVGAVVIAGGVGAYFVVDGSGSKKQNTASDSTTGASAKASSSASASASASGSGGSSGGKLSLPASADGLQLLTTSAAKDEVSRVRSGVNEGGAVYANALIGAYGPSASGGYRVVVVDQPFSNLTSDYQSQFSSLGPTAFVQQLTSGMSMSDAQTETTNASDGALSCGDLTASNQKIPTCVWDDGQSFGLAYFYNTYFDTGLSAAAQYTDAIRGAAEGG